MNILFSMIIGLFIVGTLICGFLAARHIDNEKIGSMPKSRILILGPLIPEDLLTATGKKWAFRRNICAALAFGGAVALGIVLRILQG